MTEQELRALVRDAIAKHTGTTPQAHGSAPHTFREHPSHGLLMLPVGADSDGPCIIEPAVTCNHCGHCKSYGH